MGNVKNAFPFLVFCLLKSRYAHLSVFLKPFRTPGAIIVELYSLKSVTDNQILQKARLQKTAPFNARIPPGRQLKLIALN